MTSPNLVYVASLNASQVFQQLNIINNQIDKTTTEASKGFGATGTQIGLVSGVVSSLTTEFIHLGEQAVGVLQEIVSRSVETAIQFDTLKARLGGIFDGSKEAADEAFTFIQDKSQELGIDLSELAGAFLPKTESLAQFERVAKIATALARSDPEQGAIGARIALIEALSGTFTSLQRRFEIPKEDINRIKEAFDARGIEGFLETLEMVLEESGKSFDDLANTAQTSFNKLGIAGQQLGGRLGTPIVEALEEASAKLLSFLNENEDDLIVFADTIGRAIADVIRFLSSVDLGELDTQSLIDFADYVIRIVNATELLITQLSGTSSAFFQVVDSVTPLGEILDYLGYLFSNLDQALITATQLLAISEAGFKGVFAAVQPLVDVLAPLSDAFGALQRQDIPGMITALDKAQTALENTNGQLLDLEGAQSAARQSLLESAAGLDEYYKSLEDNATAQDNLRTSLEESRQAGTDAADSILANAAAQREAAEQADKLKEAQDKVNKAMADAQKDFSRKLEDIDTAFERKRLDIAIEFAQKREEAAEKNLEKLADIRRKYAQDVQDAAIDLSRSEEDIARKFGQERLDLETEQRQKRVDIEKDYRRSLQDIQRQFLLDAEEAEQKRDAIAFLRAIKERDKKVQEAQTSRSRTIEDTRIEGEQRRQELALQQQRELEEARLANERKLEDLRLSLSRQIEEQNIAYARELDDLKEAEQQKLEEAQRARERDIEDAKLAYERKLEDLQESLAEELAVLKEGNAALEAEQARHNDAMEKSKPPAGTTPTAPTRTGRSSGKRLPESNAPTSGAPFMAGGGRAIKGYPYVVGEKRAELFVPSENGIIIPDVPRVMSNPSSTSYSNYSSSKTQEINIPMATAGQLLDPIFVAQLRNIIRSELGKVF